MKILLTISYDGTNYKGWQKQIKETTVQKEIEIALEKIYKKPISILGASRTDTHVHALDQKAMFIIEKTNVPVEKLHIVLNGYLNNDIKVLKSQVVNDDFHVFRNVKNKTYRYSIYNKDIMCPLYENYMTHIRGNLDFEKMKEVSKVFVGTHNFRSFCSVKADVKSYERTINYVNMTKENDIIYFDINGNGFLYNMVRIIVGTLIEVGQGKKTKENVKKLLVENNRKGAGKTALAKGLCLQKINID